MKKVDLVYDSIINNSSSSRALWQDSLSYPKTVSSNSWEVEHFQ